MYFQLLGSVRVTDNGAALGLGRRQERCLLGLLLLEPGRAVPPERLLDLLWNDTPPASGRGALHTYVARLRTSLAPYGVPIVGRDGGYAIDVDRQAVDVHRFTTQVARATALTDPAERLAVLTAALALWRGPLLADVADDALRARLGTSLDEQRLTARQLRAESALALGRHGDVTGELTELVTQHPTREPFTGLLMLGLYRSGRKAEALAAYRTLRDTLVAELGLEPSPELRDLHRSILNDDSQLLVPVASSTTGGTVGRFLPRDVPDFTGRAQDLARLDALAGDEAGTASTVVVSAMVGTAGVGKTALAVHWAHRMASRFPDGQLYVNLRGYDRRRPMDPVEALTALMYQLGLPHQSIPLDVEAAAAVYRSALAGKRLLILLDNARSVDQVRPLLPASAGTLVLITSRDVLSGLVARDGARRLDVPLLPSGEALELLARIVGARRLIQDRQAAADLVVACGHLPLALRIVGANLACRSGLSVSSYLSDIGEDKRLAALTVGDDPSSDLEAVFDQSYQCLTAAQRYAFHLVGLAPCTDFTVPAVARLVDSPPDRAASILRALVDAHLVVDAGNDRYTLHDLLREYAAGRATATEPAVRRTEAQCRLLTWYAVNAEAAVRLLNPAATAPPTPPAAPQPVPPELDTAEAAKAWLHAEVDNLVAAVRTATALGTPDAAWRIAFACRFLFNGRLDRATILSTAKAALRGATAARNPRGEAAAELMTAQAMQAAGQDERGAVHARRALNLAKGIGWRELEIDAHNALSVHHFLEGELDRAAEHARRALEQAATLGVVPPQYTGKLGLIDLLRGSLTTAGQYLEQTLAHDGHRADYSRAITLLNLAEVRALQGRTADAEGFLGQAVAHLEAAGNSHVKALAQADLAYLLYRRGDHRAAWDLLARAGSALGDNPDPVARAQFQHKHGKLLLSDGRRAEAAEILENALKTALTQRNRHPTIQIAIDLAPLIAEADPGRAASLAAEALEAARIGRFRLLEAQVLTVIARMALASGDVDAARLATRQAADIHRTTGHEPGRIEAEQLLQAIPGPPAT